MRLCQLLLFFHDPRESQSDKFTQFEIHSWTAVKPWNCGTLCVYMRTQVYGFNPSVICFLLPSNERRVFQHQAAVTVERYCF